MLTGVEGTPGVVVRGAGGDMRAAVIGLGYVGAVTAAGLAARGHEVVGVDVA